MGAYLILFLLYKTYCKMCDETIDFHLNEPDQKSLPFGYATYFENARRSINMHLKKAIKKPFS